MKTANTKNYKDKYAKIFLVDNGYIIGVTLVTLEKLLNWKRQGHVIRKSSRGYPVVVLGSYKVAV